LKTNGTLWEWGWRSELDISTNNTKKIVPTQVGTSSDWSVVVYANSCLAIKKDGTLWGWEQNQSGELGLGDTIDRNTPTQIGKDKDWRMVSVSGGGHTIALKTNGTIWGWGTNAASRLGLGEKEVGQTKTTPCQIGIDNDWKFISCLGASSLAMKTDGTLWGWGSNRYGMLGLGYKEIIHTPTQIK
jgi:alpha-tubulin suppressor-like RCC1 family protein